VSEYAAIVAFAFGLSGGIVFGFLLGIVYPAARGQRGPAHPMPRTPPGDTQ